MASEVENKIKEIIGQTPNYIFEYLELSDDIKKEWKYGSKASDFGGHNQYVQKFAKELTTYIDSVVERVIGEDIAVPLHGMSLQTLNETKSINKRLHEQRHRYEQIKGEHENT